MPRQHFLTWLAAAATILLWPAGAFANGASGPLEMTRGRARAIMLAALAGIVILGFGMVALIWLGARFTHRYRHGGKPITPAPRPGEHDWAKKPLGGPNQADS